MAWKLYLSLVGDAEAIRVAQGVIYVAARAQGASEEEARAVGVALGDALTRVGAGTLGADTWPWPVQVEAEYTEETLTLLVRENSQQAAKGRPPVRH